MYYKKKQRFFTKFFLSFTCPHIIMILLHHPFQILHYYLMSQVHLTTKMMAMKNQSRRKKAVRLIVSLKEENNILVKITVEVTIVRLMSVKMRKIKQKSKATSANVNEEIKQ